MPEAIAFPAEKVANRFIALAAEQGRLLTHMQVQKLVYLAHALALALYGRRLVANTFYAWKHGPVAPQLYEQLRWAGAQPITAPLPDRMGSLELGALELDPQAQEIIRQTYAAYGGYSGSELRDMTHLPGSPWSQVSAQEQYGLIPDALTQQYYAGLLGTPAPPLALASGEADAG